MLKLFNTLSRQKEKFQPIQPGKVGLYSCGPTVYGTPHIGNLRAYIFSDTLRRSLEFLGYEVTQVVNITDVGHLTTDSDAGEDKMEKGARAAGKTVWEVAKFYEGQFLEALAALNIKTPTHLPRATEHITEQIQLIEQLTTKGFTYETSDGIYFDTSKFENYGKLSGQKLEEKEAGARVTVKDEKRHPADFALWKFCVGDNADHAMRWPNPPSAQEGEGFPGWHIECSAMSSKYLGETFDIHTGGIDHIPVHHENEIAQSEAASGQKFVNYWLHNEFLTAAGGKMSKSLGNLYTLEDLKNKKRLNGKIGYEPAAFRLLCLGTHYRQKLNFTWDALESAQNILEKIRKDVYQSIQRFKKAVDFFSLNLSWEQFKETPAKELASWKNAQPIINLEKYEKAIGNFKEKIENDLNTAQALAEFYKNWDVNLWQEHADLSDNFTKLKIIFEFDKVLGLGIDKPVKKKSVELTPAQKELLDERATARAEKNWARSDEIRDKFAAAGLEIEDTADGQVVKKI